MEGTIHRIEQLRELNNLTPRELERKLGLSNGSWEKAIDRNSSIKDNIIRKVLEVFPDISIEWLVMGKGEMNGSDLTNPEELAKYISRHHAELAKKSDLYREKMLNIGMEMFINKYGHLLKE